MFEPPLWLGSWLLAYLGHSTVWLGLAWLAIRLRPGTAPRTRESIWHTALIGSIVSPTLALAVFAPPVVELPPVEPLAVELLAAESEDIGVDTESAAFADAAPVVVDEPPLTVVETSGAVVDGGVQGSMPTQIGAVVASWLPWIWLPIAAFALLGTVLAHLRLWRVLRTRRPIVEGTLPRRLSRLLRAQRSAPKVRLTVSDRLAVPVAFGWRRGEICLPERAVRDLDPVQQSSMLGHELHHLLRRDPVVLSLVHLMARVLWMQPLNLVALRSLRLSAEECCDAWAAGRTGDPVAMASCLGEVAGWLVPSGEPLPAACMARPGSPLAHRIDRLLDAKDLQSLTPTPPRGLRLRSAGTLAMGALLLPAMLPATPFAPPIPALIDEELPLETRTFALAQEIDLIQAEIHALQSELRTRGDAGIAAAERLGALESRLTRLQGLLEEALTQLPVYQETPAVPVN